MNFTAFSEAFGSATWWSRWGMASRPWRTAVVTEAGNSFLRVGIPKYCRCSRMASQLRAP